MFTCISHRNLSSIEEKDGYYISTHEKSKYKTRCEPLYVDIFWSIGSIRSIYILYGTKDIARPSKYLTRSTREQIESRYWCGQWSVAMSTIAGDKLYLRSNTGCYTNQFLFASQFHLMHELVEPAKFHRNPPFCHFGKCFYHYYDALIIFWGALEFLNSFAFLCSVYFKGFLTFSSIKNNAWSYPNINVLCFG